MVVRVGCIVKVGHTKVTTFMEISLISECENGCSWG